jgi:hypothetical protein
MNRSTALGHVEHIAAEATRYAEMEPEAWPLESMWIANDILDAPNTLDVVTMVLCVDVPAEDLTWQALNRVEVAITETMRIDKLPIWRQGRPSAWPAWNAENRRVRQFWHIDDGFDTEAIETLRQGNPIEPDAVEPHVFIEQMQTEYAVSRGHLHHVLDEYWEHPWRNEHTGFNIHPDDHLWRAAYGLQQIEEALGMADESGPNLRLV